MSQLPIGSSLTQPVMPVDSPDSPTGTGIGIGEGVGRGAIRLPNLRMQPPPNAECMDPEVERDGEEGGQNEADSGSDASGLRRSVSDTGIVI